MKKRLASELEVGDKVIVYSRNWNKVDEVARLTKTQIVLKDSTTRYRRDNFGHSIGDSGFYGSHIDYATEKDVKRVNNENRKLNLSHKLGKFSWYKLPLEALDEVVQVVNKYVKKDER